MLVGVSRRALPLAVPAAARCYAKTASPAAGGAAAAAAPKKSIKAPASVPGKAGAYAARFFEKAFEHEGSAGVLRLEKELGVLDWTFSQDPLWKVQTTSPLFDLKWKRELISKRLAAQGLSPLVVDFVMQLVEDGEVRRLSQIRVDYDEIMRAFRRQVDVILTTAQPLTPDRLELLKRSFQNDYLSPKDNIIFAHVVDESLGGGYKVKIKGQEYDHSWGAAVKQEQEAVSKRGSAAVESVRAAPRQAFLNTGAVISAALADKDTQGWIPTNFFARSEKL